MAFERCTAPARLAIVGGDGGHSRPIPTWPRFAYLGPACPAADRRQSGEAHVPGAPAGRTPRRHRVAGPAHRRRREQPGACGAAPHPAATGPTSTWQQCRPRSAAVSNGLPPLGGQWPVRNGRRLSTRAIELRVLSAIVIPLTQLSAMIISSTLYALDGTTQHVPSNVVSSDCDHPGRERAPTFAAAGCRRRTGQLRRHDLIIVLDGTTCPSSSPSRRTNSGPATSAAGVRPAPVRPDGHPGCCARLIQLTADLS